MSAKMKRRIKYLPILLLLLCFALLVVLPVLWMIFSAFKPAKEITKYPPTFFPSAFTAANFNRLSTRLRIVDYVKNSIIYALFTTIPSVFLCSLAGYGFARYTFKGRNLLFILVLATMMIPFQVTMIPLFFIVNKIGLYDTYPGLILPKLAAAISIFMMRSAFVSLPKELEESARIDGVSEFGLYWRIMLPQVKPTLITMLILGINGAWNDLMWPLLVTGDTRMRTLANGLALFIGSDTTEYGPAFAGALCSILPMLLLYIVGQKYFVEGTVTSGLKG